MTDTKPSAGELVDELEAAPIFHDRAMMRAMTTMERDLVVAALRSAPVAGAEPIAWRIRIREGSKTYHVYTEKLPFEPDDDAKIAVLSGPQPVYLAPVAGAESGVREALANACERLQSFLDTFGDVGDCATKADLNDWLAALASPPSARPVEREKLPKASAIKTALNYARVSAEHNEHNATKISGASEGAEIYRTLEKCAKALLALISGEQSAPTDGDGK